MTKNVALTAMVLAGAAWGAVFVAPELAPLAPALLLAIGRFVAFGVVSLPQARAVSRARVPWGRVVAHAITGSVAYYALVALSVRLAGPTIAVATIGLVPVVMALISARGHSVRPLLPALVLVLVGQVLVHITPGSAVSSGSLLLGTLLAVAALVSWSWYGLDSHKLLHDRPDLAPVLAGAQGLAAGALALPVGVYLVVSGGVPEQPVRALLVIAFLGLVSSWVAVRLWHVAARRLSPVLVSQLMALETAWGFVFAAAVDRTAPTPIALAGELAILGGVVLAVVGDHRRTRREAAPADAAPVAVPDDDGGRVAVPGDDGGRVAVPGDGPGSPAGWRAPHPRRAPAAPTGARSRGDRRPVGRSGLPRPASRSGRRSRTRGARDLR